VVGALQVSESEERISPDSHSEQMFGLPKTAVMHPEIPESSQLPDVLFKTWLLIHEAHWVSDWYDAQFVAVMETQALSFKNLSAEQVLQIVSDSCSTHPSIGSGTSTHFPFLT
jgi:hypothetical protein